METLLTNPSLLARYVNDFYTHVHPVESEGEQQARLVQEQQQVAQAQRQAFPQMPTGQGVSGKNLNIADVRPDQRWMFSDQLEAAGLFSGKRLVAE